MELLDYMYMQLHVSRAQFIAHRLWPILFRQTLCRPAGTMFQDQPLCHFTLRRQHGVSLLELAGGSDTIGCSKLVLVLGTRSRRLQIMREQVDLRLPGPPLPLPLKLVLRLLISSPGRRGEPPAQEGLGSYYCYMQVHSQLHLLKPCDFLVDGI